MKTIWGENLDINSVLPEYPRPQMVRDSYLNLNGPWQYAITASGKKALTSWLKEEQCINEMRYETLLKLFFGGAAKDKEVTVHNIEVFEEQVKGELAILKEYEKSLKDQLSIDDHVCYYLTVTFGIETYGAYLRWCAKAKKALR